MTISDENLMAYADAELDAAGRAAVEQAVAQDASLAARLREYQSLSGRVKSAYDGVLSEPVPARLLRALHAEPSRDSAFNLLEWLRDQSAKLLGEWAWPQWSAAAASLAVAVAIGALLARQGANGVMELNSGHLVARGGLAAALTTQATGAQPASAQAADAQLAALSVQLNLSFRNRSGEYCRAFNVTQSQPVAGVACHRGSDWQIDVLTPGAASERAGFRQAGSAVPAAVLSAVEQQISGDPLDAQAEAQALRQGWK